MKKLVLAIVAFSLTFALLMTSVIAYFTDKKTTDDLTFTLGEVSYTLSGEVDNAFVVAGVNLITNDISITNNSSIQTEVRVKITVSSSVFVNQLTLEDLFGTGFYTLDNGWVLDTGYYYYRGSQSTETTPGIFSIPPNNLLLPILTSVILDGYKFSNNHANGTINIQFVFEAKQADFITWQTLGDANYDFTIGQ